MSAMTPLEQQLLAEIQHRQNQVSTPIQRYWIAYSGGVDSHVLLFALSRIRMQLNSSEILAVHIDHQLSPLSPQWSAHCRQVCLELQIPYQCLVVDAKAVSGESPEAKARQVRYEAFTALLKTGDCLLTAHHQDDQAETLLLQLLRGAGPRGLAAMPGHNPFAKGNLCRPLLNVSREQILQYARQHQLQWIDDISNDDPVFDRNFLRLHVIPLLKQRWPAMSKTLSRSAQLCADTIGMIDAVASEDLRNLVDTSSERLSISRLQTLSRERQHNAVRAWLAQLRLACPSQKTLHHIWSQVIDTLPESAPRLQWPGAEIRRYRDHLYAMPTMADFDHNQRITWDLKHELVIAGVGRIRAVPKSGQGLARRNLSDISIRFRLGGERCKLPKRGGEHSLKNLFQEMGIVPWMRDRIPLIYSGEQLAAIGDLLVCDGFSAGEQEEGLHCVCDYEQPVR
ncbi:MAG: tRNA lysidine(34) synthetase TilS [Gammaproteobacteria bacterium]|nr:tRNA lysidine(34) synthetase TilS [Gammaproteobacteria bacterium]